MLVREIAENRNEWESRVDPDNNDPRAFDQMTIDERMEFVVELLGEEDIDEDDTEAWEIYSHQRSNPPQY